MSTVHPMPTDKRFKNLTGLQFGRLTVASFAGRSAGKSRASVWNCVCECGELRRVQTPDLTKGRTVSCGCYSLDRSTTHGHARREQFSPTYDSWRGMMERCYNESSQSFKDYGARGVTVCERWHTFANFLADMGERPDRGHSIGRVKGDLPYDPGNCRWETRVQQNRNRRNSHMLTHGGVTDCLAGWADRVGIKAGILSKRLRRGWDAARVLTTPPKESR